MGRVETDVPRVRQVLLAVGVWLVCGQVAAPGRAWADDAEQTEKIDALIAQLKGDDGRASSKARAELVELGAATVKPLVALLNADDAEVRRRGAAALYVMARSKNPPREALADVAVPLLMAYVEKRETNLSRRVLSAIGAPAVAKLAPLLRHEKPEVFDKACWFIQSLVRGATLAPKVVQDICVSLVAALGHEDTSVAEQAARTMAAMGTPALRHVLPALRDQKKQVRTYAAHALSRLAQNPRTPRAALAGAQAPLTAMTKDTDPMVRLRAYSALAAVDDRRRVQVLLQAFADPDPRGALCAVGFIGTHARGPWARQLKDKRLIERLTAAKKSSDIGLRRAAGTALQWLMDPKAAENKLQRRHAQPPPSDVPGADPGMVAGLARSIPSLSLGRVKLKDALRFIREFSRLSIVADWRALEKFGVGSSTSVTVTASNVSVSDTLRLILADVDKAKTRVRFEGIGGVVVISTTEGLAALRKARQFEQARRRLAGAADRAVWKKLDTPLPEVDFRDVPLKDALTYSRELSGLRFALDWEALGELGAHETSRVTLKLRSATIATVLWVMLLDFDKARGLAVIVNKGTVTLAKPGRVPARPPGGTARPTPPPRKPSPPKPPPDAETAATKMLRLAALYQTNKMTDRAIELYRKIVKEYPDTKAADTARVQLAVLENR